jgi:hypothetical protein
VQQTTCCSCLSCTLWPGFSWWSLCLTCWTHLWFV